MSVNRVILVGNVGKDPEVRYVEKDMPVAQFTLATTDRGFKKSNGEEVPDRTEWHNIVAWRGLAKVAESYIRKGTQLYIEGKIRTRSYVDKNQITRYITEIVAEQIELLGKKPEGGVAPLAATNTQPSLQEPPAPEVPEESEKFPF